MKIYNTLSGKKEQFVPINPDNVRIYACGVTVYDHCHIGHARSAIIFDVLTRYLKYRGMTVTYVRNFTDIDDKIINRARQEGGTWDEIAKKYTQEYYEDMDRLGVGRADLEPKATEHIDEMIIIIKTLIQKGFAYEVDGSIYFSVDAFPEYGKLSKRNKEELVAGARVEIDVKKRSPLDFALWKKSRAGEPYWESPWGFGRPGWHIECTAMSIKHLGDTFDIHGGGADLLFPHHENEIAQSEAFTGKPFAKYWVHNGFITVNKEKMSKSLGNFFTIKEVLSTFDPEAVRLFLLSTHYRSPIEFSDEQLQEAEHSLDRFYTSLHRIDNFLEGEELVVGELSHGGEEFKRFLFLFRGKVIEALEDDLNTALALGHIFELLREANKFIDNGLSSSKDVELLKKTKEVLLEAGGIFNIFKRNIYDWYRSLMKVKKIELSEEVILEKIEKRQEARQLKDWQTADNIRQELEEKGVILEDKKDKTGWKIKIG